MPEAAFNLLTLLMTQIEVAVLTAALLTQKKRLGDAEQRWKAASVAHQVLADDIEEMQKLLYAGCAELMPRSSVSSLPYVCGTLHY